jgi:hypothetical protein
MRSVGADAGGPAGPAGRCWPPKPVAQVERDVLAGSSVMLGAIGVDSKWSRLGRRRGARGGVVCDRPRLGPRQVRMGLRDAVGVGDDALVDAGRVDEVARACPCSS